MKKTPIVEEEAVKTAEIVAQCPECRSITIQYQREKNPVEIMPSVMVFNDKVPKALCYSCVARLQIG